MALSPHLEKLLRDLRELHFYLRKETHEKFKRINPFYEDLFDWKERGDFWVQGKKGITIYNSTTVVGDVDIGEGTWIGPFCSLDGGGGLSIGKSCSISAGVQILTHDTVKWALSGGRLGYEYRPTRIGDCCFLGTLAIITKGVTIGNHCVIGAGSVVTKDIPDCSIVAGIPSVIIGNVILCENDKIKLHYFENQKSKKE